MYVNSDINKILRQRYHISVEVHGGKAIVTLAIDSDHLQYEVRMDSGGEFWVDEDLIVLYDLERQQMLEIESVL